ncbi:MAG: hypothetical protein N3G21_13155 [Candidatus Hydrogenedentes bacterium]|nr:hypothetical protein [Candidatus Hydrogenedentota bacterium]
MAQIILIYAPSQFSCPKVYLPIRQLATVSQILLDSKIDNLIYDFGCLSAYKQYYSTRNQILKKKHSVKSLLRALFAKGSDDKPNENEYIKWLVDSIELTPHAKCIVFWIDNRDDLRLARKIALNIKKKFSKNLIVVGMGNYIKFTGPYILPYIPEFDCIILDHWESTIVPLWDTLSNSKELCRVPNSAVYSGGSISLGPIRRYISLEDIPIPTYEAYKGILDNEKIRIFTIEHSRDGFVTYVEPVSLRTKVSATPTKILEEISYLRKKFNSLCFHFTGEATTLSEFQAFTLSLIKAPFYIYYTRALNCLEIEGDLVHTVSVSGGKGIEVKVPTGSQRLLSNFYGIMRTVSSLEGALSVLSSSQVYTAIECFYPSPEDDRHTFAETLRFIQRVKPDLVKVSPVWLWPDSPWWENRVQLGFNIDTQEYFKWLAGDDIPNVNYPMWRPFSPDLMKEEIKKLKVSCNGDVVLALVGEVLQISKKQKGFKQMLEDAFSSSEPEFLEDIFTQFNYRMGKKVMSENWNARMSTTYRAVAN